MKTSIFAENKGSLLIEALIGLMLITSTGLLASATMTGIGRWQAKLKEKRNTLRVLINHVEEAKSKQAPTAILNMPITPSIKVVEHDDIHIEWLIQ